MLGVGALLFEDDRILMVERGGEPLRGQWSLPGGCVETGERLTDAVCREMQEETGLLVEPLGVVEIFERIMRDEAGGAEYHYVLVDFLVRRTGGTLAAADDVSQVEWFTLDQLADLPMTLGTLEVVQRVYQRRHAPALSCAGIDSLLR